MVSVIGAYLRHSLTSNAAFRSMCWDTGVSSEWLSNFIEAGNGRIGHSPDGTRDDKQIRVSTH